MAKIPDIPKDTAVYNIRQAAIIGAGTMGGGIAMACANAGISVLLKEVEQAALDRGLATIRKNYENSVKKGRFSQEVMDQRMALIHPQLTYDGFEQADLIIEAAFESMELKKRIFAEIDKIAKPDCVLASNTSTLDIDEIASVTSRPRMVIGLHFFSPANVMRLVEIVRGKATSKEVVATALALAKKLGKVGVVVGNCWGFVGNRMMLPYMREAQFLVEEGATPEQVDRALTNFGMAMGIFAVDDMGGIDLQWRVRQEYKHLEKPGVRMPLVLEKLFHLGRYGQKTGAGWYRYDENRKPIPDPEVHALIEKTAREGGIERRHITDDEIIERCIYIMINEGARILEEGYALRAADIDVIYLTGYGFPAYRGGPMWYADTVGLKKVRDRIREFHQKHGEFWEPAPLLNKLADQGETFAAYDASARDHAPAARVNDFGSHQQTISLGSRAPGGLSARRRGDIAPARRLAGGASAASARPLSGQADRTPGPLGRARSRSRVSWPSATATAHGALPPTRRCAHRLATWRKRCSSGRSPPNAPSRFSPATISSTPRSDSARCTRAFLLRPSRRPIRWFLPISESCA